MKFKKSYIIIFIILLAGIQFVSAGPFDIAESIYKYTYQNKTYEASLSGDGVINQGLTYNLSNGYIVPDSPELTYTTYNDVIDTFYTEPWENPGGGGISVIYDTNPYIHTGCTTVFKMWYQAGTISPQAMGYAESVDGYSFQKYSSNPLANTSGYFGGDVIKYNGIYYMFASNTADLAHVYKFHSSNGVTGWVNDGTVATKESWSSAGVLYQDVWMDSPGNWKMLVSGDNGSGGWGIGLWESTSPDGTWTPYAGNPVITKTPSGSGSGLVYLPSGTYKDPNGYTWTWVSSADTASASAMHTDSMRYRTNNPNDLTSWSVNPTTYLNVGPTRYSGYPYDWQGRAPHNYIRVDNLTYEFYTYGITGSPGYEGLLTTPLRIDQIVATGEMYPNLTYQQVPLT